ncbi:MAG: rhodanese-like domain-containing protein [Salinivirgaceae bacterium]
MNTFRSFVLVVFGLILLGGLVRAFIPADYDKTAGATLQRDLDQPKMHYMQLHRILQSERIYAYQFVDLRPAEVFVKDHLRDAVNIPFDELMESGSLKKLDGRPILLYGGSESDAALAALMLTQMGVENAGYIPGNFETINEYVIKGFDPVHAFYSEDKIQHCFKNYFKAFVEEGGGAPSKKEEVTVSATSGGC